LIDSLVLPENDISANLEFALRRLSILDLSANGHQQCLHRREIAGLF